MRSVEPEVFLVARPKVDYDAMAAYLREVGGERWLERIDRGQLEAQDLAEFAGKKRILICNKSDLPRQLSLPAASINVSCITGEGLEALKDAIKESIWSGEIKAEMLQVMVNSRHEDALKRARTAVINAADGLRNNQTLEVIALELRIGVNAVGEIVGKTTTEDLLDSIFSQFCIGK